MNVSESLWNVDELLDTLEQQENQIDDYRVRIAEYQKIQKNLAKEYQQKISGQDLLIQQMKSESLFVKPQIISGEIRKLFPVKMPVAICGQRQDCTLFQL